MNSVKNGFKTALEGFYILNDKGLLCGSGNQKKNEWSFILQVEEKGRNEVESPHTLNESL